MFFCFPFRSKLIKREKKEATQNKFANNHLFSFLLTHTLIESSSKNTYLRITLAKHCY